MEATVGNLLSAVASSLRSQLAPLSASLVEQITREIPELAADKPLVDLLIESVTANVVTALDVLETGSFGGDLHAPPAAVEYARRLAQRGVPITALLRAYRLGQAGFQQRIIMEMAAASAPQQLLLEASLEMSTTVFTYIDQISEQVVSAYQAERDRWMRNRGAMRTARVMSLLANGATNVAEVETALGYSLRHTHRGVIVWTDDGSQADRLSGLERVVARLADHFRSDRPPLVIAPDDATIWAWLSSAPDDSPVSGDKLTLPDEKTWVALGEPGVGVDGFRVTHRQARQAQIVASAARPIYRRQITVSAEIGLVALMCSDLEAVRAWVHGVLGPLATDDDAMQRMRETARVFLASGGSFTSAAHELMLHKNTVQYRIRKAAEIRGRALSDGRLDVEVALLAAHLLGPTVLQPKT